MSQAGVGIVIDELLTDEDLRIRFALDRIETVAELCLQGVELTRDEMNLFCGTDGRLWFVGDQVRAECNPKPRNRTRNLGTFGTQPGNQERWNLGTDEDL